MLTLLLALVALLWILRFNWPQRERVANVGLWACFVISLFLLNDYGSSEWKVSLPSCGVLWMGQLWQLTPTISFMMALLLCVAACLSFCNKNINFIKKIILFCIFSVIWFVSTHVVLYLIGGIGIILFGDATAKSKYVRAGLLSAGMTMLALASHSMHLDGLCTGALQHSNFWTHWGYACWLVALWYNVGLFPLVKIGDGVFVSMKIFESLVFTFGLSQFLQLPIVMHRELLATLAAATALGGVLLAARTQKISDLLRHTLTLYMGLWIALACVCPVWPSYETTLLMGMIVYVACACGLIFSIGDEATLTDVFSLAQRSPWAALVTTACLVGMLMWPLLSDVGVILWRAQAMLPLGIFALCLPLLGFAVFRWVRVVYRPF